MDKYDELLARADASHRILSRELGAAIRELEDKLQDERRAREKLQSKYDAQHVLCTSLNKGEAYFAKRAETAEAKLTILSDEIVRLREVNAATIERCAKAILPLADGPSDALLLYAAAATIRALAPERTVAGPSIPKRLSSAWSENLCGDGHCEDFVTRKNGIPYQFWTAEQIDAALTEYGAGDIDCCIQNQGERITDLSRQLLAAQRTALLYCYEKLQPMQPFDEWVKEIGK